MALDAARPQADAEEQHQNADDRAHGGNGAARANAAGAAEEGREKNGEKLSSVRLGALHTIALLSNVGAVSAGLTAAGAKPAGNAARIKYSGDFVFPLRGPKRTPRPAQRCRYSTAAEFDRSKRTSHFVDSRLTSYAVGQLPAVIDATMIGPIRARRVFARRSTGPAGQLCVRGSTECFRKRSQASFSKKSFGSHCNSRVQFSSGTNRRSQATRIEGHTRVSQPITTATGD